MEVREDDENFCTTMHRNCVTVLSALHCIATLFNRYKTLEFIWALDKFTTFYLSGTISRNRTMNSDANELQIGQPWLGFLCVT